MRGFEIFFLTGVFASRRTMIYDEAKGGEESMSQRAARHTNKPHTQDIACFENRATDKIG